MHKGILKGNEKETPVADAQAKIHSYLKEMTGMT